PQRIATDTSQKVAIRFGETIKAYVKQGKQQTLTAIPLVLAGWLRYLLAVDDKGAPMTLSPDPLLEELRAKLTGIRLGDPASYTGQLAGILTNKTLFGLDLAEAGLAPQVERLFKELIAGPGAVRATLRRVVSE
ncbi:MAG: mannitol dehydrogenase family protein, partial [Oscillospiraceae bacterium]|nr:mannitol dehydrogenase family protein [Oscillospiraceae bacterium]